ARRPARKRMWIERASHGACPVVSPSKIVESNRLVRRVSNRVCFSSTSSPMATDTTNVSGAGEPADRPLLERFVAGHDEAAFAALVRRHGPMVLGVCRRLLSDAHDAEDVFQATFMVLAIKAGSVGRPELLGPWLHGVAARIAARSRRAAQR